MAFLKRPFVVIFIAVFGVFSLGLLVEAAPSDNTGPQGENAKIKTFFNYVFGNSNPTFGDPNLKVKGEIISNNSLNSSQIIDSSLLSEDIFDGTIRTEDIADKSITIQKLATMCAGNQLLSVKDGTGGLGWQCIPYSDVGISQVNTKNMSNGINPFVGDGRAGSELTINPSVIQTRISSGACDPGSFMTAVSETGATTCVSEADGSTTNEIQDVIGGQGLIKDGNNAFGLQGCTDSDEVLFWNGSGWQCGSRLSGVPQKIREGSSDFTIDNTNGNIGIGLGIDAGSPKMASEKLEVGGNILAHGTITSLSTTGDNSLQPIATKDYVDGIGSLYQKKVIFPDTSTPLDGIGDPCPLGVQSIGEDGAISCVSSTAFGEAVAMTSGSFTGTITITGNLGIGTSNHDTNLEFGNSISDKIYLLNRGGNDVYGLGVGNGDSGNIDLTLFSGLSGDIKFKGNGSAGNTILALRSNGNADLSGNLSTGGDIIIGGTIKTSGTTFECGSNKVLVGFNGSGPICVDTNVVVPPPVWQ